MRITRDADILSVPDQAFLGQSLASKANSRPIEILNGETVEKGVEEGVWCVSPEDG